MVVKEVNRWNGGWKSDADPNKFGFIGLTVYNASPGKHSYEIGYTDGGQYGGHDIIIAFDDNMKPVKNGIMLQG